MKIIPLTVLAYEGPMARAYLARLHEVGLKPAHIIELVLDHHPATKRPFPRWLPAKLRLAFCERIQQNSLLYWPKKLLSEYPWLTTSLTEALMPFYRDIAQTLHAISNPAPFETYADSVETILIGSFKDDALMRALSNLSHKAVLFTGGGIMPRQLFEIPGVHYFHVHPAHLPQIRGADGLFWSILVRGTPGVSCFYMNAGLDTGNLIAVEDLPTPIFRLPKNIIRPDDQALYRILFSYYDPLVRADIFARILQKIPDISDKTLASIPSFNQNQENGVTYHFMHPRLKAEVLKKLFL